jgi:hypothetical protein
MYPYTKIPPKSPPPKAGHGAAKSCVHCMVCRALLTRKRPCCDCRVENLHLRPAGPALRA